MNKAKVLVVIAIVSLVAFLAGCGNTAQTAKEDTNAKTETSEITEESDSIVTIEEIYNANNVTDVLSRHKSITVEYQSNQGTDDILGTATYQITFPEDGNTEYVATMDNGDEVYDIQSYQNCGYIYTYNESTKEGSVGFVHPEDYIYYIQKEAYLPEYDTYTYSNIKNSTQDGALVVTADIDDIGNMVMFVDPDNYDIWGIDYHFDFDDVDTSTSITYDNPKDMDIHVLDDVLSGNTVDLTVEYINSSYSEDYTYTIPVNTSAYYVGMMAFDVYSDEKCSDDCYIREVSIGTTPLTVYAKYVE